MSNQADYFGFDFWDLQSISVKIENNSLWKWLQHHKDRLSAWYDDDDKTAGDYDLDRGLMVLQRRQVEGVGTS